MFRNSNKIPVGGDRAGPLNSMKFLKLKKNNMLKRAIKAKPENVLRRYLAMLLTVVTFITAIPLSNLMAAKAVDEYNYSITVTIDLNGGDSEDIYYKSNVDRDGCGYSEGQWVDKLGIGKTFLDREGAEHTVIGRGADTPCEGTFTVRADAVGITPYVVISTPTRDGYTFAGWDTNTDTKEYDSDTAFEVGAYAPDEVTITATWERNANSMTISWDSGVDYVSVDNYSSDYNYTTAGQSHDFGTGDTIITKAHLKSGYNMVGFQEGSKIWTDFSPKTKYQSEYSDSWTMDGNRSVKVITETTLSFEYDSGFETSAHTETVQTDTYYKDYPKLKKNYVIDYIEELGTDNKWYTYDGRDSNGSYTNWSAYKPRKIKYHSKLSEDAKKELNLEQNDATTKGTERVTVYQGMKISDITIPKREYTATFFDGNTKVHSDIINKFKFLGYWNDTEGRIHTNTTSDFKNNYRPGDIGSTNTTIDGGATYDGTTTYPFYASDKKLTTTVYAGSSDYSSARFRLDCYGFEGYVMVSYRGGSDNGESWQIEAESEDNNATVYSGYDKSAEGYSYIYIKDWIEIEACGDTSDWWTDISVVSIDTTTLKKGYWYDANGKGLINYPLGRNHTVHARWDGNDITLPEAPAKEGYTFIGWRTEDAKLQTANWSNDNKNYLDCKNNYGGDVAKWLKASREGKTEYGGEYMYLVPDSYYLNNEVMHFQYYYVDYAGDDVGLGKDTRFIACYDEIPKVTLRTSAGKGISKTYIDGTECTSGREVYENTTHTISADVKKGYKFDAWYSDGKIYSDIRNTGVTVGNTDLSLIAKANAINYKISYNLDGGTHGVLHPDSAEYDSTVTISNPTKTGYTFTGWTITGYDSTTSGHTGSAWTGETRTDYSNLTAEDGATVTFTAKWTKEAPKAANLQTTGDVGIKATSHPDKAVVNIGSNVQVSAVLNTGYVFKGWYNGDVKVSDDLSFVYTMPNKDTVLTAKTTPINYTISYDLNGGTVVVSNPTSYNIETSTFALNNPVKLGYVFVGWTGSNGTIPQKNVSIYKGSTGNKSYKANWTANTGTKYTVEYYQMNLDGKTYTKHESKTFAGTTNTKVASLDTLKKTYTGFTYVYAENADAVINSDGSTVVKLYYSRNKYILDINSWIDSTKYDCLCYYTEDTSGNFTQYIAATAKVVINGTVYADGVKDYYNAGVYYGSDVQITVTPVTGHTVVDDTSVDYNYTVSNNIASISLKMAGDKEIAPVLFTNNVNVTVNHYQMNLDGRTYTLKDTDNLTGKSNHWITPETRSYEGFTSPDKQTVKINQDGTTVVNYYYSRNQYYLNLNGYLKQRASESFADLTETVKDINGKDVRHTFATAVVKINGVTHAKGNGVTDFYEKVYYGSTYEVTTTAKTGYTIIDNTNMLKGTVTGDTVVMPHVSINQYTVKFEPNADAGENLTATTQAVYYNRQRTLNANTFKYTGYTFAGWNTKADGTGTAYTDGQTIENLSSADGAVITLYAQWKIHTHKLKVYVSNENADGSFGNEWLWKDVTLEYNTPYSYTGYVNDTVYQQISTSGTMYDSDITIHLKAMRKTFNQKLTVYYEQPDGSFDAGTVVINKAYRYGQTVSWNRNADVTYKAAGISWSVSGTNVKELKVYRQQYKITVNGADKHVTTTGSGTYRYGYELWITAEVEAGYHFINWNMDRSLTAPSMKIEVTGDKTYTAYVEANKYLITYNLNKPARASSTPKLNTQNTLEYEYNSKILYMPTTLLTGWTFEGWYTEADGGTEIKIGDIYKWIGDITLYAHWTENTYTIHYESDGGTAINDINVKYEDPVKLSAVPYRPGYIFSYWNTKEDASGHSYEGSETVRHLATGGTVTLYAVWSKKAIAQIGAAVNMTEKNGYVFGHITDDSVSIRTYVIDENGNITIK